MTLALETFPPLEMSKESFKAVNVISFSTSRSLMIKTPTQLHANLVFTSFPTATPVRRYSNGTDRTSSMSQWSVLNVELDSGSTEPVNVSESHVEH